MPNMSWLDAVADPSSRNKAALNLADPFAGYQSTAQPDPYWATKPGQAAQNWYEQNPGQGAKGFMNTNPTGAVVNPAQTQSRATGFGAPGSPAWMKYFYDMLKPQRAAQQAMRDSGISPSAANPFTKFVSDQLGNSIPLYMAQNVTAGGELRPEDLQAWMKNSISGGGSISPTQGRDLMGNANAIARRFNDLSANGGDATQMMTSAEITLGKFLENSGNAGALYALSSGMAPGMMQYLASAVDQNLIPGYEAAAPGLAGPGRRPASFLDWIIGSAQS